MGFPGKLLNGEDRGDGCGGCQADVPQNLPDKPRTHRPYPHFPLRFRPIVRFVVFAGLILEIEK